MSSVAVVGGGAAGITSALKAAERGFSVTLFEALPRLGGRLGSFTDKRSGQSFDFGEHLIHAGYSNTLKLLEMMECEGSIEIQLKLNITFHYPRLGFYRFRLPHLPPPINFFTGLTAFKLLPLSDRLRLIARLRKLISGRNLVAATARDWLTGASPEEYRIFWKSVIISALNCLPEDVDIRMVRTAFEKGFLRKGGLGFFKQAQGEIFHTKALEALRKSGVTVRLKHQVKKLMIAGGKATHLLTDSGDSIQADKFILALPPQGLLKLLGDDIPALGLNKGALDFGFSDICNVHLVFERRIFEGDFGCLLESLPQWYFRRRWGNENRDGVAYSLTISAADKLIPPGTDVVKGCLADLKRCGADLKDNRLLYRKVILSRKATVILSPESSESRPGAETAVENLLLAGDWTDTGLPATIESAVMSGFRAGEMI